MIATEVTAGPAESNGSLLLGLWRDSLHVTCGLTACTPGSAAGSALGNEYGKTLPFFTETPLTLAAVSLATPQPMMQTLIGGGAHIDFRNSQTHTAIHRAALKCNRESIKVLPFVAAFFTAAAQRLIKTNFGLMQQQWRRVD